MSTEQQRAKEIFLAALDQPDDEITTFIEAACAGNAELRRRVDKLLAAHRAAGAFLATPTHELAATHARQRAETPASQVTQPVVAGYRLLEVIGEGGFGTVYRAAQDTPVRREVALKTLKLGMDTRQVIARFEAERQTLAIMNHPNIAQVFDAGATDAGRPYFVMELVEGAPITQYCDQRRDSISQRLELLCVVCDAIRHAHQKGIIHRDLKPNNVLIAEVDGRPVPKVIDFGIAKAVSGAPTDDTALTEVRQIVGTPQYMSPEQAGGGAVDIDTRSDIYALGVLLYELLTGTTPIELDRLRSASLADLPRLLSEAERQRPSSRVGTGSVSVPETAQRRGLTVAALRRHLRGDLDWIVMKALAEDRERRYATVDEFSADLQRYLTKRPVAAGPPSRIYRFRKFAARHATLLTVTGVSLLLLVALVIYSLAAAARASRAEREARAEETRATAIASFLQSIFAGVDPAIARGADTTLLEEILHEATERVDVELADQPAARASIRNTIGLSYYQIGAFEEAEEQLELAQAIAARRPAALAREGRAALAQLVELYIDWNRLDEAQTLGEELVQQTMAVQGPAHPETLLARGTLGRLYLRSGQLERAEQIYESLADAYARELGPDHENTIYAVHSLASVNARLGRNEQAARRYAQVLRHARRTLGEDHPDTLTVANSLGLLYVDLGDYDRAIELLTQVLADRKRILPSGHPHLISSMSNLAVAYKAAGRLDDAERLYLAALEASRAAPNHASSRDLMLLNNLGSLYLTQQRYVDAKPMLAECLQGARRQFGDGHPNTVGVMRHLAEVHRRLGELNEARVLAEQAVAHSRTLEGAPDLKAAVLHEYGATLMAAEEYAAAEPILLEAYDLQQAARGPQDAISRAIADALCALYGRMGDSAQESTWCARGSPTM